MSTWVHRCLSQRPCIEKFPTRRMIVLLLCVCLPLSHTSASTVVMVTMWHSWCCRQCTRNLWIIVYCTKHEFHNFSILFLFKHESEVAYGYQGWTLLMCLPCTSHFHHLGLYCDDEIKWPHDRLKSLPLRVRAVIQFAYDGKTESVLLNNSC